MILVWGLREDAPVALVLRALAELRYDVTFVDQRDVLMSAVSLTVDDGVAGELVIGGTTLPLSCVQSAYVRPYDCRELPQVSRTRPGSQEWEHALEFDQTLWSWADLTSASVLNRPSAMNWGNSKPYQAEMITSAGFDVPETLITTDPDAAWEFWQRHGAVVYKSVSSVRSVVSQITDKHRDRLGDVVWCPTQFQQYIPGTDVRVHVIGDEVVATEVISDVDDYRYAQFQGERVTMRGISLSHGCADRCRLLTRQMGLSIAGIDLRRATDEDWYCFEVNPSPAFSYYETDSNNGIARSIARLLAGSCSIT